MIRDAQNGSRSCPARSAPGLGGADLVWGLALELVWETLRTTRPESFLKPPSRPGQALTGPERLWEAPRGLGGPGRPWQALREQGASCEQFYGV